MPFCCCQSAGYILCHGATHHKVTSPLITQCLPLPHEGLGHLRERNSLLFLHLPGHSGFKRQILRYYSKKKKDVTQTDLSKKKKKKGGREKLINISARKSRGQSSSGVTGSNIQTVVPGLCLCSAFVSVGLLGRLKFGSLTFS